MASAHSSQVSAFVDESGKFKDHKVIAIGCVAAYNEQLHDFAQEWGRHLILNGLNDLSAKKALNYSRPLSKKNTDVGLTNRIDTLRPFVACIRKHLQVAVGCVVDVRVFKQLPSHFFQVFGSDPSYMAFMRIMLQLAEFASASDKISLICDEDEQTALAFYRLYRRIKKVAPGVQKRLVAISFADDRFLFALQAADLIAALIRLEKTAQLIRTKYDYKPLYKALVAQPEKHERIWYCGIATGDKKALTKTATNVIAQLKKEKKLP
jgi:Protein of unknown function (DUF3800)